MIEGLTFYQEIRDDIAVKWIVSNNPEALIEVPRSISNLPVYDDKEVIGNKELFYENAMVLISFIVGNRDAKDNGWIVRFFGGVRYNSKLHVKVIHLLESQWKGKMQPTCSEDL